MQYLIERFYVCRSCLLLGSIALFCLFLSHCQRQQPPTALSLLSRAAKAHGGQSNWQRLKSLQYTKQTTLFREDGSIESDVMENHDYRWEPDFSATIRWEEAEKSYRINQDADGTTLTIGEMEVTDSSQITTARRKVKAALYTVSQPFNILNDQHLAQYEGMDTISGGQEVEVVKIAYPGGDADTWWYFFDPETGRCVANLVYHEPTYALIHNRSFEQVGSLLLHRERETYRVDSLRQIQYIRARYQYYDYTAYMD